MNLLNSRYKKLNDIAPWLEKNDIKMVSPFYRPLKFIVMGTEFTIQAISFPKFLKHFSKDGKATLENIFDLLAGKHNIIVKDDEPEPIVEEEPCIKNTSKPEAIIKFESSLDLFSEALKKVKLESEPDEVAVLDCFINYALPCVSAFRDILNKTNR